METVGFFDAEILKFPEASPPGKLRVEAEGKQNSLFCPLVVLLRDKVVSVISAFSQKVDVMV